jgi:murein DD-endopeptidase MepM/ murein hydrolase activator NlpD
MLPLPSSRPSSRPGVPAAAAVTVVTVATLALGAVGLVSGAGPGHALATGPPGPWDPPVDGAVQQLFDPPALPWSPGHRGVDLDAPPGTPVRSPAAGAVTFAGQVGGKPVVVVSHGALRSTFEPVEARRSVGEPVVRGDVVGTVTDDTAAHHCDATGCLHWGVRRGEAYLDPLVLLGRAAPVVLLPQPAG